VAQGLSSNPLKEWLNQIFLERERICLSGVCLHKNGLFKIKSLYEQLVNKGIKVTKELNT
jgi:hypothetical protein